MPSQLPLPGLHPWSRRPALAIPRACVAGVGMPALPCPLRVVAEAPSAWSVLPGKLREILGEDGDGDDERDESGDDYQG